MHLGILFFNVSIFLLDMKAGNNYQLKAVIISQNGDTRIYIYAKIYTYVHKLLKTTTTTKKKPQKNPKKPHKFYMYGNSIIKAKNNFAI